MSTLQGADHYALDEVALQERIHTDDGQRGDDDHGALEHLRGHGLCRVVIEQGIEFTGHQDLPQDGLNRILRAIRNEQDAVEVSVPIADRIEQGDGRNGRQGDGQQDAQEILEVGASVNGCGLIEGTSR